MAGWASVGCMARVPAIGPDMMRHIPTACDMHGDNANKEPPTDLDRPGDDGAGYRHRFDPRDRDHRDRCGAQRPRGRPGVRDRASGRRWKRWTTGTATSTASPVCGSACSSRASRWRKPKRDAGIPGASGCRRHVADVRQLDLPGSPVPASPDAEAGSVLPLPQPRRQHDQGAGRALGATVASGPARSPRIPHSATSAIRSRSCATTVRSWVRWPDCRQAEAKQARMNRVQGIPGRNPRPCTT